MELVLYNSNGPNDIWTEIWVHIGSGNVWLSYGAKPLSGPMLTSQLIDKW